MPLDPTNHIDPLIDPPMLLLSDVVAMNDLDGRGKLNKINIVHYSNRLSIVWRFIRAHAKCQLDAFPTIISIRVGLNWNWQGMGSNGPYIVANL